MSKVHGQRRLDGYSEQLFGEGAEVLINPDLAELTKALSKVQARARTHRLSAEQVADVFRQVAQQGYSSAHAGVVDCPSSFNFGITSTVIQVARLSDSMIGCFIGRRQALPGQRGAPPVSADPFENPRQWLNQVVTAFWTKLDDAQIAAISRQAVCAAMELTARRSWGDNHDHGAARAGIKRRLQLQVLFRSTEPVYMSELAVAARRIVAELKAAGESEITWRAFQLRWPSLASRYKRDLLGVFRQGLAQRQDLAELDVGPSKFSLSFDTWSGAQTIFGGTQLVFQVCNPLLSTAEGAHHRSTFRLRRALREAAEQSPHPVTRRTVGWFRVHVDDLHRLVFIDEVQSDVMEYLHASAAEGDKAAKTFARELADWQTNGFSTIRHWAASIDYRVAMHSEQSAAAIANKTRSARKWNVYYRALIKRFGLSPQRCDGYPAEIFGET